MSVERWFLLACVVLAGLLWMRWEGRPVEHGPGVLAPAAPEQTRAGNDEFRNGDFILTRRAHFDIHARVLSHKRYYTDSGAGLSSLDLALGWGPMSDQSVLDQLEISQSGRWYHLRWGDPPPIPERVIMGHSGNMHIIPANDEVAGALDGLRDGQLLRLQGYLVDARNEQGFTWKTSLSRDDTGGGSCELFYVEQAFLQ